MSKKQQRAIKNLQIRDVKVDVIIKDLKLPDLQRQCIIRGMDFNELCESSVLNLHSFLINNWDAPINRNRLSEFDNWYNAELKEIGCDDLIHPLLDLGHTINNDTGETVKRRVKKIKPEKKVKRERTEDGIFKGTKKAYTFELAKKGLKKSKVIDLVLEKFPEANEKSISIWFNKAKKQG